jgi:hypothetical protein
MISVPGRQSVFGPFFNNLRTWWLTLDRHCGAFIVAGGPPAFTNSAMPADAARMINRQYLVQHGNDHRRLLESIGNIPPAEAEEQYHAAADTIDMAA